MQPKIAPFDPPSPKTLPRIKHEVDQPTVTDISSFEISDMLNFMTLLLRSESTFCEENLDNTFMRT